MPPVVLLTGKDGQLGRAAGAILPGYCNLVALGRDELDICDRDAVARAVRSAAPDIIVNAASYTDVDGAERDPRRAWAVNRDGVAWLADAARRNDALLIHISTDFVFGGDGGAPYGEADATGPVNEYGRSKLAGEIALAGSGARYLIVRTSWLFSEFAGNFVSRILTLLNERDTLSVVDDQIGTPTDAHFLAEVLARLIADPDRVADGQRILHVANAGAASRYELANHILDCARRGRFPIRAREIRAIATTDYPLPARRPADTRLAIDRLRAILAVEPPDWQGAVATIVSAKAHR